MAPVYKLKYFDTMGLAEPIRYLLAYGKIDYENEIIDMNHWPAMKTTVPFGEIPVLTVDDKELFHCIAICRFLGHRFGLMVDDEMMTAEMDCISGMIYELATKIHDWHCEEDQTIKNKLHEHMETYMIPTYMKGFEEWLLKKGGYFGGKMSWVDMFFVAMMETIEGMWGMHLMQLKHPALYQLVLKVRAEPTIMAYLEKRPHHDY